VNAAKYLSSILVVVLGLSWNDRSVFFWCAIVWATCFKWGWDVVMDFGLFEWQKEWLFDAFGFSNAGSISASGTSPSYANR
jgi:hypothetical protein